MPIFIWCDKTETTNEIWHLRKYRVSWKKVFYSFICVPWPCWRNSLKAFFRWRTIFIIVVVSAASVATVAITTSSSSSCCHLPLVVDGNTASTLNLSQCKPLNQSPISIERNTEIRIYTIHKKKKSSIQLHVNVVDVGVVVVITWHSEKQAWRKLRRKSVVYVQWWRKKKTLMNKIIIKKWKMEIGMNSTIFNRIWEY